MNKRIVLVKKGNPHRLLPEGIHHEIVSTIGSKFSKDTRTILKGLNPMEEKILLPRILGITPNDPKWYEKVELFYRNLEIRVPHEGTTLNITTNKTKVLYEGNEITFDTPEVPTDYIKWKQCLADSSVADSFDQMSENGVYKFYLVDEEAEKEKANNIRKEVNKVSKLYNELVETDNDGAYINKDKMRFLMYMLGFNPSIMTADDMSGKLDTVRKSSEEQIQQFGVEAKDTKFAQLVNDKDLKAKAKISRLLTLGILVRSGKYIVDANNPEKVLGESLNDAISFMSDPNNSNLVAMYQHELTKDREINNLN